MEQPENNDDMVVIIVVTTFEPQADDQKSGTITLNSNDRYT